MTKQDNARNLRLIGGAVIRPKNLLRTVARSPLEASANDRIAALPRRELTDYIPGTSQEIHLSAAESRHDWSLGIVEQLVLQLLIEQRAAATAFEIGTFNGGTTKLLAETLPADGRVVTLDLPPAAFDATQSPDAFSGSLVGTAYRSSPARSKITQELCDSLTFDYSPYHRGFDVVLVDGAHDYEHGYSDSRSALDLVRPGGIIVWDDFEPYWHGLIHGILDATNGLPVAKLAGTSFAILEA